MTCREIPDGGTNKRTPKRTKAAKVEVAVQTPRTAMGRSIWTKIVLAVSLMDVLVHAWTPVRCKWGTMRTVADICAHGNRTERCTARDGQEDTSVSESGDHGRDG